MQELELYIVGAIIIKNSPLAKEFGVLLALVAVDDTQYTITRGRLRLVVCRRTRGSRIRISWMLTTDVTGKACPIEELQARIFLSIFLRTSHDTPGTVRPCKSLSKTNLIRKNAIY